MQKIYLLILSCSILLLNACNKEEKNDFVHDDSDQVIYFSNSVKIIRELLKSDSLSAILEDVDSEKLDFLINNFSPAEIAFESEVLSCIIPVVLYAYQKYIDQKLLAIIKERYQTYKIVLIDADAFPAIVESLQVNEYPMFIFFDQRVEAFRLMQNQLVHQLSVSK